MRAAWKMTGCCRLKLLYINPFSSRMTIEVFTQHHKYFSWKHYAISRKPALCLVPSEGMEADEHIPGAKKSLPGHVEMSEV